MNILHIVLPSYISPLFQCCAAAELERYLYQLLDVHVAVQCFREQYMVEVNSLEFSSKEEVKSTKNNTINCL